MLSLFFKKREINFPNYIEISNFKYGIEVHFIKKKSSSVRVKKNILIFRLSSYLSSKKIESNFNSLLNSMIKKLEKTPIKQNKSFSDILTQNKFIFFNTIYNIEFTNKVRNVKLIENNFYVNINLKPIIIEKYFVRFLINKYESRLKEYINILNNKTYNFTIKDFKLKSLSSKWGHCTHDNKIMINIKLLNTKTNILDYVIIHELCHIKIKNHSKHFWNEVEKYCPNYKLLRKELKENPPEVFI